MPPIGSRPRARACARYGVLVVGEEMKGLVNCNFLPGSAPDGLSLAQFQPSPCRARTGRKNSGRSAKRLACRARVLLAKVPIALKRAVGLSGPSSSRQSAPILQQWSEQVCRSFEAGQAMSHSDANCAKPRTGFRSRPAPSTVARACARYGVLVVGEEMKGLVNCNFLPGSARRLELGTVSPEPLSRAYWSQKLRPLGETVGLSRARTSGESPDSTQAGRGPQWPIQLAAISAHPAAMVGTGMPKLRGRTGNEAIAMPTAPSLERDSAPGRRTPGN